MLSITTIVKTYTFIPLRHEGQYSMALQQHVIVSNKFNQIFKEFKGCRVILCTLSMLSNKLLVSGGLLKQIPIQTLVIDEAGQIMMSKYKSVLLRLGTTLEKMCFIGDDKQRKHLVILTFVVISKTALLS